MKSKLVSSAILLAGLSLMLGSCLNDDSITPPQRLAMDIETIDEYLLANPPAPQDIIIRDAFSGIRMVITEPGTGEVPPTPENIIQVSYVGRRLSKGALTDPFDQRETFTFTITTKDTGSDVIDGWKFALGMMTEGTKARVYIPSGLGYGPGGSGSIPGNAILVFDIHLKVVNTDNEEPRLTQDKAAISFFVDEQSVENVQVHPSGLHYVILNEGSGDRPGLYDHVKVNYSAKLMNVQQTVFINPTIQGPVTSFSSRVVNYIHGLNIGLQLMNAGGKARFYIPSSLAYGPTSTALIPANSNVIFEVELLEVTPNME